jgi:hypothetical protein
MLGVVAQEDIAMSKSENENENEAADRKVGLNKVLERLLENDAKLFEAIAELQRERKSWKQAVQATMTFGVAMVTPNERGEVQGAVVKAAFNKADRDDVVERLKAFREATGQAASGELAATALFGGAVSRMGRRQEDATEAANWAAEEAKAVRHALERAGRAIVEAEKRAAAAAAPPPSFSSEPKPEA